MTSPLSLRKRINELVRKEKNSQKVFFDTPGLLDQSQHWGGLVIWTIAAGTSAALIWAFLGRVDQTVSATGTLEPVLGKVVVKSPSGGIVRNIWVNEGELVPLSHQLVRIENLGTKAQLDASKRQLALLSYENDLLNLLIDLQGQLPNSLPLPAMLIAKEDRVRSVQLTVQQTGSQLRQLRSRLSSQLLTLQLKTELADSMSSLYKEGSISRFNYLTSKDDVQQSSSQVSQTREQINILVAQAGRQVSSNTRQLISLQARIVDLEEENRNLLLKSTTAGRIFNLAVQPGSVIASGAEVMRIIPEGGLRASVFLANSDLGFVSEGQVVKLAVSSFPPGEYGYLDARVTRIGADSLQSSSSSASESQSSSKFPVQITIDNNADKSTLLSRLKPGMQVSALIVVRQRPVISLLTDTFTKGSEALQNTR